MSQSYRAPNTDQFERLWRAQNGLCALCGGPMLRNRFEAPHARIWAKDRATLDHIWPKSKGGTDAADNLQLAHARCNKVKGNRV
ncbi:MAG: HNH endonuclease [Pseudomonadota bacterium]